MDLYPIAAWQSYDRFPATGAFPAFLMRESIA
jgi:hypothetical protein